MAVTVSGGPLGICDQGAPSAGSGRLMRHERSMSATATTASIRIDLIALYRGKKKMTLLGVLRRRLPSALCVIFAVTLLSSPALADPSGSKPISHGDNKRSTDCIQMAKKAKLEAWFCTGGNVFDARTGEQKSDNLVQRQRESAEVSPLTHDWDYWCEAQTICDRQISNYIMETKVNYEWGTTNSEGVYTRRGLWDEILRINLNGRQARFWTAEIWDYGPSLYVPRIWARCWEQIDFFADEPCGEYTIDSGVYISSSSQQKRSEMKYTARLNDSNEYYLAVHAQVRPTGYGTLTQPPFESPLFYCYGNDNCYFP